MRFTPDSLERLVHDGIVDRIVRPLMSGKEAHVYLVESGGEQYVAKIYKDAQQRSFQNRADYTEGRKMRSSRDQRAVDKRSAHGKAQDEAAWRSTEVDMIHRLHAAGVRVPTPHHFVDGVLIMELVKDRRGEPAPRLAEVSLTAAEAKAVFARLLGEVQRMLCAGVVHGDLSDYNVLMAANGPVIIDFPQAVNAARNQSARKLLLRDVENLHRFVAALTPGYRRLPYGEEMWQAYERGELTPTTALTGDFREAAGATRTSELLSIVREAERDERKRREKHGESMRGMSRPTEPKVYQGRPLSQHPTLGGKPRQAQRQHPQQKNPPPQPRGQQKHPQQQKHAQQKRPQQKQPPQQQHGHQKQHSQHSPQQQKQKHPRVGAQERRRRELD